MINCLSNNRFANLLFVNVQIGDVRATALFDTGAGMTVIKQSLLHRLHTAPEKESFCAGNNNGVVRAFQTATIPSIRIGDICTEKCKVLVMDDDYFALGDESGRILPADMLLGWDVISRYRWSYSAKDECLSVSLPERTAEHLSPEIKQGPVVFPEYDGERFKARIDTGHTGTILGAAWYSRLSDIEYHESEIAGVGASQYKRIPYVRVLRLRFQNQAICLRDVDIFDELYGQPAEIEALLGYDFLEGRDWLSEQDFRLLPYERQDSEDSEKSK